MKALAIVLLIACLVASVALVAYTAGRTESVRACPPTQHGEKLLYSEQRASTTLCAYAAASSGYGRTIKRRRP